MATFTALNVEPDDTYDENVDNTKEIQIEEALKLYQNALKLHSQGPQFYDQAGVAYDALFKSEVFRYPESVTEFNRIDGNPQFEYEPELALPVDADLAAVGSDGSPSTLPQILYLAYKNHGQFIIDCLKHQMRNGNDISRDLLNSQAWRALHQFSQALARDESDTDLWRRVARIGATLGSRTIARYCLEAALEVDDDPTERDVEPAGPEEGFAGVELKGHLEVLADQVGLSHPIMVPYGKKIMNNAMEKYMDPYPFLPDYTKELKVDRASSAEIQEPVIAVESPESSWCALAEALWRACILNPGSGAGVVITLPDADSEMAEVSVSNKEQNPYPMVRLDSGVSIKEEAPNSNPQSNLTDLVTQQPRKDDGAQAEPASAKSSENNPEPELVQLTRKRSQSVAGIQEPLDEEGGAQKRSKRIRNRDTIVNDSNPVDSTAQFKEQLEQVREADDHTFNLVGGILGKFNINELGTLDELQDAISSDATPEKEDRVRNTSIRDLRDTLRSWNDNKATILMSGGGLDVLASSSGNANAGLVAFLEHSKTGLKKVSECPAFSASSGLASFVKSVNDRWLSLPDVVFEFLKNTHPTYIQNQWPDLLKNTLCRLINLLDANIFGRLKNEAEHLRSIDDAEELSNLEDFVQMLFEIHLDIYASITDPNSVIDIATRTKERESLERWRSFAFDLIAESGERRADELSLRFLWSSAFFAGMSDGTSREHVISCWNDMQLLLEDAGNPVVELQNNAIMPEISASAASREISRLTSMDFFLNLFQSDKSDPLAIIETLEPVLDPISVGGSTSSEANASEQNAEGSPEPACKEVPIVPTGLRDMWKFLEGGSTSLRLFLWQRLREAYKNINYSTKVFSCHLKSLEIIVSELRSATYLVGSSESRQQSLLNWLKTLDDLLVKSLTLALNDSTAFEIIDDAHIKSTAMSLAQLCRLLHSVSIFEDGVQVGMVQLPHTPVYSQQGNFGLALVKLREMQVRSWGLLYTLVKDGMSQNRELFDDIEGDLADYMAAVHSSLGLRKICKLSNKILLKMIRIELIRKGNLDRWEDYASQVLFDLHGIRLGVGVYELQDHGCLPDPLDKKTTLSIADRVIALANSMPMKDLLKSELRATIEKMQQSIGAAKNTSQTQHNLRNYTEYLKSSIHPLRMIEAFKGKVFVDSIAVASPEYPLADKGWYFLLGMMALTKFRSQKRLSPGATDDLKVAASFFRLQLQFTSELWETWYRLAQCFDAELEEDVLWSADKLNAERPPLVQLQRSAIHCYVMALSTAMRTADASFETASKLSDMYHDFGARIYSSSREPFKMEAFYLDEFERHFSGPMGMYKKLAHEEMSRFKAWRYAAGLFQRALREMPNNWMTHYLLGKCLWKMYTKVNDEYDERAKSTRPSMKSVLKAFIMAIKTCPKPRDNRVEPIIEPHYKLMSIAHKLVIKGDLHPQEAADMLQRQPYAIRKGEAATISDIGMWGSFILDSIRHIRNADKSNWHHRMIYRAARIVCPNPEPDWTQANNARAELKDSMFTKTMVVQVWKPEFERPGRHCVYMERYVRWMVQLLWILEDKLNLEALVKRVRKKQIDYYHFSETWTECCNVYMRLIRRSGSINISQDEALKSIPGDEFTSISDSLEPWISDPSSFHPALNCLREAVELKKLNANLMKATPIDDLIGDCYATLFLQVGVNLPRRSPPPEAMPSNESRAQGPMSLNSMVSNMDGSAVNHFPAQFSSHFPPLPDLVRPKSKTTSKREILRRAEAALVRAPEAPRPLAPIRVRPSDQSVIIGSGARSPVGGPLQPRITIALRDQENNEGGAESSAPGSLHDSADDESDLSDAPDIEEEAVATSAFTNLRSGSIAVEEEVEGGEVDAVAETVAGEQGEDEREG